MIIELQGSVCGSIATAATRPSALPALTLNTGSMALSGNHDDDEEEVDGDDDEEEEKKQTLIILASPSFRFIQGSISFESGVTELCIVQFTTLVIAFFLICTICVCWSV